MKIVVTNAKGGVGKTTTCVTLAHMWKHLDPVLLDIDAQEATRTFDVDMDSVKFEYMKPRAAAGWLAKVPADHLVIVDCPGSDDLSIPVLGMADLILLPFEAGFMPFRATVQLVEKIQGLFPGIVIGAFITRYQANSPTAKEVRASAPQVLGEVFMNICVPVRYTFEAASARGNTIDYYRPLDAGTRSYRKLAQEIEPLLEKFNVVD